LFGWNGPGQPASFQRFKNRGKGLVESHQPLLVAGSHDFIGFAPHHLGDALAHDLKFPPMQARIFIRSQPEDVARFRLSHFKRKDNGETGQGEARTLDHSP